MAKRRVLEKLKLTEISAVDFPCQVGARVAILKRADPTTNLSEAVKKLNAKIETENSMSDSNDVAELQGAVCDLEARIADLAKKLEENAQPSKSKLDPFKRIGVDFHTTVSEIRKRDNCSRTEALAKARKENPEAFDAYLAGPVAQSDASPAVAKLSVTTFMAAMDDAMREKGLSRTDAMREVRKREPAKFEHYQNA